MLSSRVKKKHIYRNFFRSINRKQTMLYLINILTLLLFSLLPHTASCGVNQNHLLLLEEANSLVRQANESRESKQSHEKFEKALLRFEKISTEISNGKLLYNIGNTYYRLGDIGRAIAFYRRAEQLIPSDINLKQNLRLALKKRQDTIYPPEDKKLLETLFFLHYDLSPSVKQNFFLASYVSFWLCAGLMFFSAVAVPRWVTGFFLFLALLLTTSLAIDQHQQKTLSGVIVAKEIMARQGDGINYKPSFTEALHAGTEFTVIGQRPDWLHVELQDGKRCWLPAQSSLII